MKNFKRKNEISYEKQEPITYDVVQEDVIEDGQHLRKVICKPILQDPNEGLRADDFSLSNLIAAGATDLLQPIQSLSNTSIHDIDSIADSLTNLTQTND